VAAAAAAATAAAALQTLEVATRRGKQQCCTHLQGCVTQQAFQMLTCRMYCSVLLPAADVYCPNRKELCEAVGITCDQFAICILCFALPQATDAAAAAYCPNRKELCAAAGIADADLLLLEPETTTTRPAYAVWVDAPNMRIVWGFRGTTDLNDMLTDACASCEPYDGGYAHWGMLQVRRWTAQPQKTLYTYTLYKYQRMGY
jgi:hypothetical protein